MNRWRPSRAGILNVWRFHDETFTFHDGRLLIRGANGAGKSKSLELLLPHLLDATPPSAMHWNLMGDEKEGIRAGYVWLEFQKNDEWFTVGARLQASTSTTDVQASYFTTSMRIGDLNLVNEAGRPLTRVNLARALGGHGEVHGDPEDYKTKIRTTLFTGMSESTYDSMISPNPINLLPPLNVPAVPVEHLERQREKLGRLDDAIDVTEKLIRRQHGYARNLLHQARTSLAQATERLRELKDTTEETEEQQRKLDEALQAEAVLSREAGELDARLNGILSGERLEELRQQLAAARARALAATKLAAELRARADEDTEQATSAADAARQKAEAADAAEKAAMDAAQRAGVPLDEVVDDRITKIREVRKAVDIRDRATKRLDQARDELAHAEAEETRAAQAHEAARAKHDDDLAAWTMNCRELVVLTTDDQEINEAAGRAREEFSRLELGLEERHTALTGQLTQYRTLREKLSQIDVPPPAPYTREASRTDGAPLWRLVEFRPHMPLSLCAAIEAALEASGLLDAWITPDSSRPLDHDTFADEILAIPAPGASLLDMLVAEQPAVQRLLGGIAFGETAPVHPAAVGADGTWRLGSLRGRWTKAEPTYIGADARELAAERRVAELASLIDKLETDLAELDEAKHRIAERRETLATELANLPGRDNVDETGVRHIQAQERCAVLRAAVARAEQERDEAEAQVTQAEYGTETDLEVFRAAQQRWRDEQREARIAEQAATSAQARAVTSREHADQADRAAAAQAQQEEELSAALGTDTDRDHLDRLRARRNEITTELEELRKHRGALEHAVRNTAHTEELGHAAAAKDAAEERLRRLMNLDPPEDIPHEENAEQLLTYAVEDARLALPARVTLELEPGDDVLVVTAALDRKPVSTEELLDWVRAERDRTADQVATGERELLDKTLTPEVRERIEQRLQVADELVGFLNERLAWFGLRFVSQVDEAARDLLITDPEADHTAWHRLVLEIDRGTGWQPLTSRLRAALSAGERAVIRDVTRVAVLAAHYRAAPTGPRLIVLDSVFTGMDSANRSGLLELLVASDLDLVLTSDSDWGDYRELPGIAIHQLVNSDDAVTSVRFTWTGAGG